MSNQETGPAPMEAPKPAARRRFGRGLVIGSVLLAGVALGAGGLAVAATAKGFGMMHGPKIERVQNFVRMALDSVAATSDQEAKIHDIVAKSFDEIAPKPGSRDAFRKQVSDLLRAPTIDKAAIEKLRAEHIADMDAKSKKLVEAVEQAAEILTPEQRAKLADKAEEFGKHRGGPWHHKGMMRHGMGDGRDDGPDDGPDAGPDAPPPPPAQ